MPLTIGVDVGGTKVAAGVVDDDGKILARQLRPTPSTSAELIEAAIASAVTELCSSYDVTAVGIGAAGWVDAARTTVVFAPNLAWRNEPLRDEVARLVDLPVYVENDANAAAWGEHRFGAGRGESDMVCITVGTGIGSGFVFSGHMYRGHYGFGAEAGHMRVVPDGRPCGCGQRGCWEQYASGRALVREAQERAETRGAAAARLLELAAGDVKSITGPHVTTAASEGDPLAVECFRVIGRWLGQGLASLAAILDPGRFVISGGVSEAGDLLVKPAREAYAEVVTGGEHRPPGDIRLAELGPDAGLVGAADLARVRD